VHILLMRPRLEVGGASRILATLAGGLVGRGHRVSLATSSVEDESLVRGLNIRLLRLPLYPSGLAQTVGSAIPLAVYAATQGVDVIHSHHRFSSVVGKAVGVLTNVPLVTTVHEFKRDRRRWVGVWVGTRCVVPSEALRLHLVNYYGIRPSRLVVIPNAIEVAMPRPSDLSAMRSALHLPEEAKVVGFVGRLSHEKGADLFLAAAPRIRSSMQGVRFLLIGDGPQRAELEGLADESGVRDSVVFIGEVNRASDYIPLMDVVVVPSREESFSLVALEAMAHGRPVVATRVGGIPEVVRHELTGLLVDSPDASLIASAVAGLVVDPGLSREMGRQARRVFGERHSSKVMVDRYLEVYCGL